MIFHSAYRLIIKQLQISAYLVALFLGVFFDRGCYSTSKDMRHEMDRQTFGTTFGRTACDHVG
jgi:hypothetical protein